MTNFDIALRDLLSAPEVPTDVWAHVSEHAFTHIPELDDDIVPVDDGLEAFEFDDGLALLDESDNDAQDSNDLSDDLHSDTVFDDFDDADDAVVSTDDDADDLDDNADVDFDGWM